MALSVTVLWRTVHGRSAQKRGYVGKWKFISGEIKVPPGFPGVTTKPLTGNSAIVAERDGALWYQGSDGNCWYQLRLAGGKAEVVPGGKVECDTAPSDQATTSATLSMEIDAQDRAHFSGEARSSLEFNGTRRDLTFSYDGIAVRDGSAQR